MGQFTSKSPEIQLNLLNNSQSGTNYQDIYWKYILQRTEILS